MPTWTQRSHSNLHQKPDGSLQFTHKDENIVIFQDISCVQMKPKFDKWDACIREKYNWGLSSDLTSNGEAGKKLLAVNFCIQLYSKDNEILFTPVATNECNK